MTGHLGQEIQFLFPPLTYIQKAGEEYMELTKDGVVTMIPVRLNANQLSMTCDRIVGQKKELHITAFEYALEKLRQQLLGKEGEFAARFSKDFSSSISDFKGYSLERFVDGIWDECRNVLAQHRDIEPEDMLDDVHSRFLVQEMLSTVHMAQSKLDLYLEDTSRCLMIMKDMKIRDAHRERMASLYRKLDAMPLSDERVNISLQLCKTQWLLKESVHEKNELGETKIFEAAAEDWKPSHIRLLTAAGADVNEKMAHGTTPTIKAAMCGHTTTVKELHSLGADVKAADNDGMTAIVAAAAGGHTATVKELHSLGADDKAARNDGRTALMLAAWGGHTATVKELHSLGADLEAADNDGMTAVIFAAWGGHTATVKELHSLGADIEAAEKNGMTAVMLAAGGGHTATVKELHSLGGRVI